MSLKPEEWDYTNPVLSQLYGKPPIYWNDARVQLVVYETTEEIVESVIPYPLEPAGNKVIAWVSDLPETTQGAYHEAAIYVQVQYEDYVGTYEPFLYVDSEVPLAGGREIWGYCKKLADISVEPEKEIIQGTVERAGTKIMDCKSVCERPASIDEVPLGPVFSLKVIPGASEDEPTLRELVYCEHEMEPQEGRFFGGKGSVRYEKSEIDPTYIIEPKEVLGGYYGVFDVVLHYGEIVHRYEE